MLASRKPSKRHSVAVLAPADHAHPFRNLIFTGSKTWDISRWQKGTYPPPRDLQATVPNFVPTPISADVCRSVLHCPKAALGKPFSAVGDR
jgi:hypothetical protein